MKEKIPVLRLLGQGFRDVARKIRRLATVLVVVLLLVVNIASLTLSSVSAVLSGILSAVTSATTLYDSARLQSYQLSDLKAEYNKVTKELRVQSKATKILAKEVVAGRAEIKSLKAASEVTFRGKKRPVKEVAEEVASSVKKRVAKSTAANVGSIAGEGIPYWGIAIILASTTVELKAACDSMRDMDEFLISTGATSLPDPETTHVCGMQLPTVDSVWQAVKQSPRAVWIGAASSLESVSAALPDPDFSGWWQTLFDVMPDWPD